jgi:hypothetical protein
VDHIEKVIEAAAETVVADAVAYVKAHPNYGPIVAAPSFRKMAVSGPVWWSATCC